MENCIKPYKNSINIKMNNSLNSSKNYLDFLFFETLSAEPKIS